MPHTPAQGNMDETMPTVRSKRKKSVKVVEAKQPKTFVLDSNVLMSDPQCFFAFDDNNLVIPLIVLEELDKHKNDQNDVGKACREVNRFLDSLRCESTSSGHVTNNLGTGVSLPHGGTLRVDMSSVKQVRGLDLSKPDNRIIACADQLAGSILVTRDIAVRVKCDALDIPTQDYLKQRVRDDTGTYTGVRVVQTTGEIIDELYLNQKIEPGQLGDGVSPNEIIVLKAEGLSPSGGTKSALTRLSCDIDGLNPRIKLITQKRSVFGITAKNKEQEFALELLLDPSVQLVTITGTAGCGKTFISIAAAFEQLIGLGSTQVYEKLVVCRPTVSVDEGIGFLPGTLDEKLHPWMAPVRDTISTLLAKDGKPKKQAQGGSAKDVGSARGNSISSDLYIDEMQKRGIIEIQALSYIRGRSISNACVLIDEAQNTTLHEIKTIITRMGEGSKVILCGDIEQIDAPKSDSRNNGLSHVVQAFRDEPIAGHVSLLRGERSLLATIAARVLLAVKQRKSDTSIA